MNIALKDITEEEFFGNDGVLLFEDSFSNKRFGELKFDDAKIFRLAWHSDLVDPEIIEINQWTYCIGVDQHFAIINVVKNLFFVIINLNYNFFKTKLFATWIFVITELQILKISQETFEVVECIDLPDFFEEMTFSGNIMTVNCTGGVTITHKI